MPRIATAATEGQYLAILQHVCSSSRTRPSFRCFLEVFRCGSRFRGGAEAFISVLDAIGQALAAEGRLGEWVPLVAGYVSLSFNYEIPGTVYSQILRFAANLFVKAGDSQVMRLFLERPNPRPVQAEFVHTSFASRSLDKTGIRLLTYILRVLSSSDLPSSDWVVRCWQEALSKSGRKQGSLFDVVSVSLRDFSAEKFGRILQKMQPLTPSSHPLIVTVANGRGRGAELLPLILALGSRSSNPEADAQLLCEAPNLRDAVLAECRRSVNVFTLHVLLGLSKKGFRELDDGFGRRFLAQLGRFLDHPNIRALLDALFTDGALPFGIATYRSGTR
jgi:hypothetical protein